ncbi:MAG: AmmeMemoRadiSam system protein A [Candidatus Desulfofervidaceae bacterium]|nr:AmmeMemoRadiSam system protein A [Candidatus Desulfofervidaceae bacterium]MDL1971471.1 AmmeMemoRadiSam system protein A [Candidatus Desulfofervidaceae bacterium]
MKFTTEQKRFLLTLARDTIRAALEEQSLPQVRVEEDSILAKPCGVFVTLHKNGALRGCIGSLIGEKPLYITVQQMALEAAFRDPRFHPLTKEELLSIEIEISVLSPLQRITNVEQIEVGKHGIFLVKGFHRGVLLPQVATEYGWDRYTFLDHTCLKAGLTPGCWRSGAEIYIFSAEIFSEKDFQEQDTSLPESLSTINRTT